VSRALGVLAKLGFFVLVVVGGVFLFRKDTMRGLSERWAMRKCPELIAADIRVVMPWSDPKVTDCQGTPGRATCAVETTERSGRKSAPVRDWDCSKRHISENFYREFLNAALQAQAPEPGVSIEASNRQMVDRTLKVKEDFVEAIKYVADKLRERYETLGEPSPWPAGPGFPSFPFR
jgi:hypothetical protein